ncbi:ATP-binding protein [Ottowia sp.]|uniref:sensor histidine kinase n=1 Tax=Ottowia sp. TaxID=1898956 RepID=UPI003C727BA5
MALWFLASIAFVVFFVLSPATFARPQPAGQRLGTDVPFMAITDPEGRMTAAEVAAMPQEAFTRFTQPLNKGYAHEVYWLRVEVPMPPPGDSLQEGASWLEILPTYLDKVTLYQLAGGVWHEQSSGDTVPMAERIRARELVLPLLPGRPFILRVQTTSPMQLDATLWRSAGLISYLSNSEWASGVHQGINLMHALLIIGAALALRMRSLAALAVASVVCLAHGAADRGYLQLWLPAPLEYWGDLAVKVGTLVLPAALAWQFHEVLSLATRWPRADRLVCAMGAVPLLCLISIPLGTYSDWAWFGVGAPWAISAIVAVITFLDLAREGPSLERLLLVLPSTAYGLIGLYVTGAYLGWAPVPEVETSVLWQLNTLLVNIVVTVAVGTGLVRRFRDSVEKLARSEHTLEERVRQRTAELLQTQNTLQAALASERTMREEQRQFFDMVNHEFRTPLAVIDSAATEQWTFPSSDADEQKRRAAQMRRMCRRMADLMDNCLADQRLEAASMSPQRQMVNLRNLVEDAAQIVQWSPRHRLVLDIGGLPAAWPCDPLLARMALSNLTDNAVKHALPGEVRIAARVDEQNCLRLSVSDRGPGLPPDAVERLFERGQRGGAQQVRGFGLGLWAARRIAHLHGGEVEVAITPQGGSCFTLILPHSNPELSAPVPSPSSGHPYATAQN